ncbi:MAG: hypothetical protein D3922_01700 [Candidatus Electrothrix sp. AR1]|nr:hypothetical protein [Candidatus Electrothrix sp. AR1]
MAYLVRVKSDFFFRGIKGQKQYSKGQWVEGSFREIMGRRMFVTDGFFLKPEKFDQFKSTFNNT